MKKTLTALLLVLACLLSLTACGGGGDVSSTGPALTTAPGGSIPPPITSEQQYSVSYYMPAPALTDAPQALLLDWDIKSVRTPFAITDEDTEDQKADYSMPIYRFDTYEEFLHLTDIIGKAACPTVSPEIDESAHTVKYFDYREGTFSGYSLLLGWFSVETPHTLDCYDQHASYEIVGNELRFIISGGDTCDCTPEAESRTASGLIWLAVPKAELEACENFAFILKNCLISESVK